MRRGDWGSSPNVGRGDFVAVEVDEHDDDEDEDDDDVADGDSSQQHPRSSAWRVDMAAVAALAGCTDKSELLAELQKSEASSKFDVEMDEATALRAFFDSDDADRAPRPSTDVAVISCAARPGPLDTPTLPKLLTKVGETTLISHCLRGLRLAGLRHIVVVVGGVASKLLVEHLTKQKWSTYFDTWRIVELGESWKAGHAASLLASARTVWGGKRLPKPFMLVAADHIYDHRLLRRLANTDLSPGGGAAGVVLVELDSKVMRTLKVEHRTSVRVVTNRERTQIREIGRDLPHWTGMEAGAFVLGPEVFEALRGLSRAAPYFTLSEALACFATKMGRSRLLAVPTEGMPWLAVETDAQRRDANKNLERFAHFKQEQPKTPLKRSSMIHGFLVALREDEEEEAETENPFLVDDDDDEEKAAETSSYGGISVVPSSSSSLISASSLANLIALADEQEGDSEEEEDDFFHGGDTAIVVSSSSSSGELRHALALVQDLEEQQKDAPSSCLPVLTLPSDIESITLSVVAPVEDELAPGLILKVKRRVPVIGYILLGIGVTALATSGPFSRDLPPDTPPMLRSFWRQFVSGTLFALLDLFTSKKQPVTLKKRRRTATFFLAIAACGFATSCAAYIMSMTYVPAAIALTYNSTTPLWLSAHMLTCGVGTSSSRTARVILHVGAIIGFLGTILVARSSEAARDDDDTVYVAITGALVGLLGGVGNAFYLGAWRRLPPGTVTNARLLASVYLGAAPLTFFMLLATSSYPVLTTPLFDATFGLFGCFNRKNIIASLKLSVYLDGCGEGFIVLSIRYMSALSIGVAMLLQPTITTITSSYIVTEKHLERATTTPREFYGSLLTLLASLVVVAFSYKSTQTVDISSAISSSRAQEKEPSPPPPNMLVGKYSPLATKAPQRGVSTSSFFARYQQAI